MVIVVRQYEPVSFAILILNTIRSSFPDSRIFFWGAVEDSGGLFLTALVTLLCEIVVDFLCVGAEKGYLPIDIVYAYLGAPPEGGWDANAMQAEMEAALESSTGDLRLSTFPSPPGWEQSNKTQAVGAVAAAQSDASADGVRQSVSSAANQSTTLGVWWSISTASTSLRRAKAVVIQQGVMKSLFGPNRRVWYHLHASVLFVVVMLEMSFHAIPNAVACAPSEELATTPSPQNESSPLQRIIDGCAREEADSTAPSWGASAGGGVSPAPTGTSSRTSPGFAAQRGRHYAVYGYEITSEIEKQTKNLSGLQGIPKADLTARYLTSGGFRKNPATGEWDPESGGRAWIMFCCRNKGQLTKAWNDLVIVQPGIPLR